MTDLLISTAAGPAALLVAFLLTYAVHSSLLLGGVWLALRWNVVRSYGLQDLLWKTALLGGLLTAALQVFAGTGVTPQVPLSASAPAIAAPPPAPAQLSSPALPASVPAPVASRAPAASQSAASPLSPTPPLDAPPLDAPPIDAPMIDAPMIDAPMVDRQPAPPAAAPAEGSLSSLRYVTSAFGRLRDLPWTLLAAFAWLLGVVWWSTRRLVAWHAFHGRIHPREPLDDASVRAMLDDLARTEDVSDALRRRLRVTVSTALTSPVSLGRGEICLPERALTDLTPAQLRSVLAHELAHLVRCDPQWLLALTVFECLFFFQPLNVVGRARQYEVSEYLCDAWAVRRTGNGTMLAQSLLEVASWFRRGGPPLMAVGMARPGSPLSRRIERLVHESREAFRHGPPRRAALVVAAVVGLVALTAPGVVLERTAEPAVPIRAAGIGGSALPALPLPAAPHVESASAPRVSIHASRADTTWRDRDMDWSDGEKDFTLRTEGTVTVSDDGRRITSISPGGYLLLTEVGPARKREVRVTANAAGALDFDYRVDGDRRTFDERAQGWLADALMNIRMIDAQMAHAESVLARSKEALAQAERDLENAAQRLARLDELKSLDAELMRAEELERAMARLERQGGLDRIMEMTQRELERAMRSLEKGLPSISRSGNDGTRHFTWQDDDHRIEVSSKGAITFSAAEDAITGVSEDGYFEIEERVDGTERRLRVTSANGALVHDYRVDGRRASFDAEGRTWLADVLPSLLLRTGFDHEARTARYLKTGGVDYVLQKLAPVDSDYALTLYGTDVLRSPRVDVRGAERLLDGLLPRIESDYHRAELLKAAVPYIQRGADPASFLEGVAAIESDRHRRVVATAVLDASSDAASCRIAFATARRLESDYDAATLLEHAIDRCAVQPERFDDFVAALRSIESDHHRGEVLTSALNERAFDAAQRVRLLQAASEIGSDHIRANVLLSNVELFTSSPELFDAMLETAAGIPSDFDRGRVLGALGRLDTLTPAQQAALLDAIAAVDSDYHKAELLTQLSSLRDSGAPEVRSAYDAAVESIESDFHYRRLAGRDRRD